jgi:glutamine amidotransferase-like uncharacterized protein
MGDIETTSHASVKHARYNNDPSLIPVALYLDKERGEHSNYKDGIYKQLRRCLDQNLFTVEFVTNDQIESGYLTKIHQGEHFPVLVFPGGSVFSQEASLSDDAVRKVWRFVSSGGGVLGICAGAFLLGASGYDNCKSERCMLGAETMYLPGKGTMEIQLNSHYGRAVFGKELCEVIMTVPFSHAACFRPVHNRVNHLLEQQPQSLSACYPLARFVSVVRDGDESSGTVPYSHYDTGVGDTDTDGAGTGTVDVADTAATAVVDGGVSNIDETLSPDPELTEFSPMVLSLIGRGRVIAIGPHPESQKACPDARKFIQLAVQFLSRPRQQQQISSNNK